MTIFFNTRWTLGYTKFPEVDAKLYIPLYPEWPWNQYNRSTLSDQSPTTFSNRKSCRRIQWFHWLRKLHNEITFQEEWLQSAFQNMDNTLKNQVTCTLFDRVNEKGKHLVSYKDYRLTSQDLSLYAWQVMSFWWDYKSFNAKLLWLGKREASLLSLQPTTILSFNALVHGCSSALMHWSNSAVH